MGTCVVVAEHRATDAVVLTASSPSLEDLGGQVLMYHSTFTIVLQYRGQVLMYHSAFTVFLQYRGHMTEFCEEDRDDLFGSASRYLEFHRWAFNWKKARLKTAARFRGHTGVQVSLPVRCPTPALTCLSHIFEGCECTSLPYQSSVPRSTAGQPTGATLPYTQVMMEDPIQASE